MNINFLFCSGFFFVCFSQFALHCTFASIATANICKKSKMENNFSQRNRRRLKLLLMLWKAQNCDKIAARGDGDGSEMENVVNAVAHIKPAKKSALIVIYRFITRSWKCFYACGQSRGWQSVILKNHLIRQPDATPRYHDINFLWLI